MGGADRAGENEPRQEPQHGGGGEARGQVEDATRAAGHQNVLAEQEIVDLLPLRAWSGLSPWQEDSLGCTPPGELRRGCVLPHGGEGGCPELTPSAQSTGPPGNPLSSIVWLPRESKALREADTQPGPTPGSHRRTLQALPPSRFCRTSSALRSLRRNCSGGDASVSQGFPWPGLAGREAFRRS